MPFVRLSLCIVVDYETLRDRVFVSQSRINKKAAKADHGGGQK